MPVWMAAFLALILSYDPLKGEFDDEPFRQEFGIDHGVFCIELGLVDSEDAVPEPLHAVRLRLPDMPFQDHALHIGEFARHVGGARGPSPASKASQFSHRLERSGFSGSIVFGSPVYIGQTNTK